MFDRFTDKAKKSLNLARIAAQSFNHTYIAPEHMLHGVLSVGECRATQILAASKVVPATMLEDLDRRIVPAEARQADAQLPFTSDGKRALEGAMMAASEAGHDYIGTEHLLIGLSDCGSLTIEKLFRESSLTRERLLDGLVSGDPEAASGAHPGRAKQLTLRSAMVIAAEAGDFETAARLQALLDKLGD